MINEAFGGVGHSTVASQPRPSGHARILINHREQNDGCEICGVQISSS